MVAEDPLGLAQFEDKYRLAMELFEVRILLEPEVAAVASRNAMEEEKQHIKELCDETERKTPEEIDAVLAERKAGWKGFESKYQHGLLKLYAQHAVSSMKGAYME